MVNTSVVDRANFNNQKLNLDNPIKPINFQNKINIYALTDSHQRPNLKARLVTELIKKMDDQKSKRTILIDNGDLFKGIYPAKIERNIYLKLKKKYPDLEIVVNIGNNDPGYNDAQRLIFKKMLKKYKEAGIHVLSANIWDEHNNPFDGVKPYTVIERNGKKLLLVGFCINLTGSVPKVKSCTPQNIFPKIAQDIKNMPEKPDGIILLNHDYLDTSKDLMKFAKENDIEVNFLIGGHTHVLPPDYIKARDNNIFYPDAYCRSMIKFRLDSNNDKKVALVKNKEIINSLEKSIDPLFKPDIDEAEEKFGLNKKIADFIVPLSAERSNVHSESIELGTFLADYIKHRTNSDIAIFSSGFIGASLDTKKDGKSITAYDLKEIMPLGTVPIEKIELSTESLKKMFENGFELCFDKDANPKLIAFSNDMKVEVKVGHDKDSDKELKERISQIYINNQPLLDKKGKPLDNNRKFTCAIDKYIGSGNKNYGMLKELPRLEYDKQLTMEEALIEALKNLKPDNPNIDKENKRYKRAEVVNIEV